MLALALVLEGVDPEDRGGDLRDGPADAAGLGSPLQCGGARLPISPSRSACARIVSPESNLRFDGVTTDDGCDLTLFARLRRVRRTRYFEACPGGQANLRMMFTEHLA
jgi:hypothetical protein